MVCRVFRSYARKSFEEAERMARCLIETTLTKFPHAKLILSGILPRFWDDEANQIAKQLNESFKHNCKLSQRVKYVDHTKCVLTDDGYLREDLYWDDVHLNNEGLSGMVINLRAVEWVHSVVISRGEVIVNETSPTSARYIGPILHASLHVYCMDHNSIERMR